MEEHVEHAPKSIAHKTGKAKKLELVTLDGTVKDVPRLPLGMAELDRVMGGGLVRGSATLIGGDPGIGKSTLLLQVAASLCRQGLKVAYISGEESQHQIGLRAQRLNVMGAGVQLGTTASLKDILATLEAEAPDVAIIDSVQTLFSDAVESAPGSVAQLRACSYDLIRLAKKRHIALFLVGHVTKEGAIAGPRVLEHMVDTVLYFEGERGHQFRILRAVKNRFGGTDEIGIFAMGQYGLEEVANPSALFLTERDTHVSGTAVFAGLEGTRPVMVEIQALIAPSFMSNPRRAVVGWDSGRLAMLLAVLETRCGISLSDCEVYVNIAGGFRITEPAADLAIAAAMLSALTDTPIPADMVLAGEIGLSGEVRPIAHATKRLREAAKLGFRQAMTASMRDKEDPGLQCKPIAHVQQLAEAFAAEPRKRKTNKPQMVEEA